MRVASHPAAYFTRLAAQLARAGIEARLEDESACFSLRPSAER